MKQEESLAHSTILTLLGYRRGTRHKKPQATKKSSRKRMHPLVAAHTDVGVITMLLFDAGDCAVLQRQQTKRTATTTTTTKVASTTTTTTDHDESEWIDVQLPRMVPVDPIFVVNIADCLSDLCNGYLPSTLHRVVPRGVTPRNCLALFVGLDPKVELRLPGSNSGVLSYEEWRRRRIADAQSVLKGGYPGKEEPTKHVVGDSPET